MGGESEAVIGRKAEVRSPQTNRRQLLILVSFTRLPVFFSRKCSRNCKPEVWSNTSELTQPPLVQGEAITIGTRKPSPIGLSNVASGLPVRTFSCSTVTYSSRVLIP